MIILKKIILYIIISCCLCACTSKNIEESRQTIYLKLNSQNFIPSTRILSNNNQIASANTPFQIDRLDIWFCNDNQIIDYRFITSSTNPNLSSIQINNSTTTANSNTFPPSGAVAGANWTKIDNISTLANKIIIIANANKTFTPQSNGTITKLPKSGESIEKLKELKFPVYQMVSYQNHWDAYFGKKVTLFSNIASILTKNNGNPSWVTGDNGSKYAEIFLGTALSRLEFKQIQGNENIQQFKVEGVYLNKFYGEYSFSSVRSSTPNGAGQLWNAGSSPLQYSTGSGNFYNNANDFKHYYAEGNPASKGVATKTGSNKATISVDNNHTWYFQLAPNSNTDKNSLQLIIKLSQVKIIENGHITTLPGEQFITINKFKHNNQQTGIYPGFIYKLEPIVFGPEHISPIPNADLNDFYVKVNVTPWGNTTITPDIENY